MSAMFRTAAIALVMMSGTAMLAGQQAPPSYPNPYTLIESPLTPPRKLGPVFGLDVDRNGRDIWVYDICGRTIAQGCLGAAVDPIMKFDASGKFVKSFGADLIAHPHGLYVDPEGNVWATDGVGGNEKAPTKGFQVFKFSPDGKLLLTLGTAGVLGKTETTFNMPTDVVVAKDGTVFVADGGIAPDSSQRIVKFTRDGKFIKAWGTPGTGPGQFSEPHCLAFDSRERLFVCDRRGNLRIQIFDKEGMFLDQWAQFPGPSEIFIDKQDVMYVTGNQAADAKQRGIYVGSAKDGRVTAFIPIANPSQELLTVDADGVIWTTSFAPQSKVEKYVRK